MAVEYDPIKRRLGSVFNKSVCLRKLFYRLLDLLLLRTWHVKKEIRRWASDHPGERKILDAGSGFGQYMYYLSKLNNDWVIDGVDVKQEQIDDCNAFFERADIRNVSFQYADLTRFVRENTFDFILSVDVMEHIEEDRSVFANFHRSLKPGGMLLISTPSDQGGSDVHSHDHDSFIDEHVRDGYSITEIGEKLTSAGFSSVDARYSYGRPGKISWLFSMKIPLVLLNFSRAFYILLPFYYVVVFPFAMALNFLDVRQKHTTGTGLIVRACK
ncbi:MAG: class I SAM-dependent methyltransferase [Bacteroidales bacterium]|nr:class I SAM-dependent methyltransferase [Bacteroidales bacterium]